MLTATPKHWFSWDFTVQEDSNPVARIDASVWREKASLSIQGQEYRVYREGVMSGAFYLESGGQVLARAEKPSAFRRSFVVGHAGKEYTLQAKSAFGRAFVLLQGSQPVGEVAPLSLFTRRARIQLPETLPLPVRVFVFWLVLILWKRQSDSAAASG